MATALIAGYGTKFHTGTYVNENAIFRAYDLSRDDQLPEQAFLIGELSGMPQFDRVIGLEPSESAAHLDYAEKLSQRSGGRFERVLGKIPATEEELASFPQGPAGRNARYDAVFLPHLVWIAARKGEDNTYFDPEGTREQLEIFLRAAASLLAPEGKLFVVEYTSQGSDSPNSDWKRLVSVMGSEADFFRRVSLQEKSSFDSHRDHLGVYLRSI
ncbi:MAG: hypothetical protein V1820_03945 [archaeon]